MSGPEVLQDRADELLDIALAALQAHGGLLIAARSHACFVSVNSNKDVPSSLLAKILRLTADNIEANGDPAPGENRREHIDLKLGKLN